MSSDTARCPLSKVVPHVSNNFQRRRNEDFPRLGPVLRSFEVDPLGLEVRSLEVLFD